jgi:RHS repeat-associated protein
MLYQLAASIKSDRPRIATLYSHVHAVTGAGSTTYAYDANGNMITRGDQSLTWDYDNHPTSVSDNSTTIATFVYDGDGNRVLKTEGGETILYVSQYYEVNVTTEKETCYYYLGGKLVAKSDNGAISYIHQDSLSSTSLMTDASGTQIDTTMKYLPFGGTLSGSVPTDKLFTGQRLDSTGLYYYGARNYDPTIGRFISPDIIVPNPFNPQSLNRYSYCLNNPLKYIDPSGHIVGYAPSDPGMDYMAMVVEYYQLKEAWEEMKKNNPELAQSLEESEELVTIMWGEVNGPYASHTSVDSHGIIRITLDSDYPATNYRLVGDLSCSADTARTLIYGPDAFSQALWDAIWFLPNLIYEVGYSAFCAAVSSVGMGLGIVATIMGASYVNPALIWAGLIMTVQSYNLWATTVNNTGVLPWQLPTIPLPRQ